MKLLTKKEAAVYLRKSEAEVIEMVLKGDIRMDEMCNFKEDELEKYVYGVKNEAFRKVMEVIEFEFGISVSEKDIYVLARAIEYAGGWSCFGRAEFLIKAKFRYMMLQCERDWDVAGSNYFRNQMEREIGRGRMWYGR